MNSSKPEIKIIGRFTEQAFNYFKKNISTHELSRTEKWGDVNSLNQTEVLIIRSDTKIEQNILKKMPLLKCIITSTSGFDHIDLEATNKNNIVVMHTPEANAQSACELTWGLILNRFKKMNQSQEVAQQSTWPRESLVGRELKNLNIAIIGMGRVGTKVKNIAKAFEMKVYGFDPYVDTNLFNDVQFLGFEECIKVADIVTFHVPLTRKTKNMINKFSLESFHDDSLLVNCSRGEIIDESALLHHLRSNLNFQVALDVFSQEPLPMDHPFRGESRILLTPHIGATTVEALKNSCMEAAQKAIDFISHKKVTDSLPPTSSWWLDR